MRRSRSRAAIIRLRKIGGGNIKRHAIGRKVNRRSSSAILADLKHRLSEIYDLNAAESVLFWDEATYMPTGGAVARGRQAAMLKRLAHERSADPALGKLIDRLEPMADRLDADDASLIRIARRDFERAIKVPAEYVARAIIPQFGILPCMECGSAGERLRRNDSVSGKDTRPEPGIRLVLRFLRPYRRSTDRRRGRGYDDSHDPAPFRRAATRAHPPGTRDMRSAADGRRLPASLFRRGGATRLRPVCRHADGL